MEHEKLEDDEDWVIVKKQRIIILIPPPSPIHHQTEDTEAFNTNTKPKRSNRRRLVTRKKKKNLSEERDHKSATFLVNTIGTKDNLEKPVGKPSDKSYTVFSGEVKGPRPVDLVSPSKDGNKNHKKVTIEKSVGNPCGESNTINIGVESSTPVDLVSPSKDGNKNHKKLTIEKSVGNPCGESNTINIGVESSTPVDLESPVIDGTKNPKQVNVCWKLLLQHPPVSHLFPQKDNIVDSKRRAISSSGSIKLPIARSNVVNRKIRALNFQRRLQMFGGLRSWLLSMGLSQLMKIIEREKLGTYQLVDLTMSKLKDMGVIAVGPRRKLINAIDSLCQPYYLKALK